MSDSSTHPDPRCPRCGYDLTALCSGTCPECGLEDPARPGRAVELHYRPWLHRFALVFVIATFCLVILGGTVTSKGVGLSVPDWPTSYGYNMFLFPPSMWVGGVFWEHTHRLLGALVGMLAIGMALALWATQYDRPWLRKVGLATLGLVIVQGVMGGLRVTEMAVWLAVLHGVTAQLFLCLTVLIAAATGRGWLNVASHSDRPWWRNREAAQWMSMAFFGVVLIQLILGATMRHCGAGLAIPDFPGNYGGLVPPLSQPAIDRAVNAYIAEHGYDRVFVAINAGRLTPFHVAINYAHRVWALVVLVAAGILLKVLAGREDLTEMLRGPMTLLGLLLMTQVVLGALVIWTGRHPEVATAHQVTGAAVLATAFLIVVRVKLLPSANRVGALVDDAITRASQRMEGAPA